MDEQVKFNTEGDDASPAGQDGDAGSLGTPDGTVPSLAAPEAYTAGSEAYAPGPGAPYAPTPAGPASPGESLPSGARRPPGAHFKHRTDDDTLPSAFGGGAIAVRPVRGRANAVERLVVIILATALAVAWFHKAWAHPIGTQVGIPGDADEYDWFLSWVPWAIFHGHNPLVSWVVDYPKGINLMWNTSIVLPSMIMAPITALFGAPFSYNVLITLSPALDTTFAYFAFRRWCGRLPSLAGALVFGFSPFVAVQAPGHLAQVLMMSLPLMLIVLDRLLVVQTSRPWRDGLMLGVLAWAQLLTSEELLAMEVVVAALVTAIMALVKRRQAAAKAAYALRGLVVSAVSFCVLGLPFLAYQFLGPFRVQGVHPANFYVTDLLNFVVPSNIQQFTSARALAISATFAGHEDGGYLGAPVLLLMVFAVIVARRRAITWAAAGIAIVAGVLSMGETLHVDDRNTHFPLPGAVVQSLPFMKNLLPARYAGVTALGAGLLVALGLTEVGRARWGQRVAAKLPGAWSSVWRWSGKIVVWLVALAGLVLITPQVGYYAFAAPKVPAFTTGWVCPKGAASGHPPRVTLVMPADNEVNLLWQAETNFCFIMPSATGMTGTHPIQDVLPPLIAGGDGGPHLPVVTPTVRAEFAQELEDRHITSIVVDPESPTSPPWSPPLQALMVAWLEQLLGRPPTQYVEMFYTYMWAPLPPYSQIATGHFTTTTAAP